MKPIQIKKFSKYFGEFSAVKDLSFEVNEGDIFAFLGSNGSGKTTTIRCLLDIYQADAGKLLINGSKYTKDKNNLIGYLPEERGLYTRAGVEEVMQYFLKLRHISGTAAQKLINEYLEKVDLIEYKNKRINQLSSGMQQKVQIGLSILHSPQILVLDEPFKGLDPVNRQLFIDIFSSLNKDGTTIMYSSHVIDEVQKLASRLVIIDRGKKHAYGTINDVRRSYGTDTLKIEFAGLLPENKDMYLSRVSKNTAELIPKKASTPEEILKYLLGHGVKILNYRLDYPSLNEIFINIVKQR